MNRRVTDAAFDRSFDDLAALAYRVAYRLLGSRPEAEDVAQEAMTRAYARWRRVRGHAEPWVARVATNLALDSLRRRARRPESVVDLARSTGEDRGDRSDRRPSAESAAIDRIELGRLLAQLPRRQREVVVLRYLADRSEIDTASELGTSVGSVKQHAHRGLAALRTAWAGLDADPFPEIAPEPGAS
ncbi:MAG: putative polymerase subfamily sigma factor [Acidimicrobiales bacterium]|nr:putative polymerase subfamily sigma factor [Acidimicrobiales bacterium]